MQIIYSGRRRVVARIEQLHKNTRVQLRYLQERGQDLTLMGKESINFVWWRTRNWGDALNPMIIERLSGKPVRGWDLGVRTQRPNCSSYGRGIRKYLVVGSTLGHMTPETEVWGAGLMFENEMPHGGAAAKIHAVRGPLSRKRLQELGMQVPAVYGDPALLCTRLFDPAERVTHPLGVIPHEEEKKLEWVQRIEADPKVKVIDITSGLENVVKEITSCSMIASSSLHGLIVADAFGIPWSWLVLSDKVGGNGFKFQDYFWSTGRKDILPARVEDDWRYQDIVQTIKRMNASQFNESALLDACPFLFETVR